MKKKVSLFGCLLFIFVSLAHSQAYLDAARGLLNRTIPKQAGHFVLEPLGGSNGKDVFEIISIGDKLHLRGNNAVALSSALYYYLKEYCHTQVTWFGSSIKLPEVLPSVNQLIRKVTPYDYRYYLNYCTFNYSMSWWTWERWEKEIDWMALHGINMPLAITGQAWIWREVYHDLGFSDKDLNGFFSGPSYFAWFYMGNLDGWGGPLPLHWMETHRDLQKKILARERALGMKPVLPAFTGHVPAAFKKYFPNAKLKKTNWNGSFGDVYILDPSDPLFTRIGQLFLKKQTETYGTDHLYSSDTFNENIPPTDDTAFLRQVSEKLYDGMRAADPDATWVMQGWLFHYQDYFWKLPQIKALLSGVPDNRMIILDLYTATYPMWPKTNAYFGKPWIWNMLQNFGGNISLYGRMDTVAAGPAASLDDIRHGRLAGIGLTPEAIEQNPVLFELMTEHTWRYEPIDLDKWLPKYIVQRYGYCDSSLVKAWQILRRTVYAGSKTEGGPESIITARPTFAASTDWARTQLDYDPAALLPVWKIFLQHADRLKSSEGFRYDLADISRQVLANYADSLQHQAAIAYQASDAPAFRNSADSLLTLIGDLDDMLAAQPGFILGKWLQDARNQGISKIEKDLYEFNARDLITLWGDKDCVLHDYSCRQWSGLLKGFYRKRWQQFFDQAATALKNGKSFDQKAFESDIKNWEWEWVNAHEEYPSEPKGDVVSLCQHIYGKYGNTIWNVYGVGIQ